jgi:hypothetical protein
MLVDTDVLIWYLRGNEKAARFLESLRELKLSAVTWMERCRDAAIGRSWSSSRKISATAKR